MTASTLATFDRTFFGAEERFTRIGSGDIGGKASGLLRLSEVVATRFQPVPSVEVAVPRLVVVATDHFDRFMNDNALWDVALSDASDDVLGMEFQKATLPPDISGDLWALAGLVRQPLAVRSSSLLEDARERPFAGVYATKMTPNDQPDHQARFHRLVEAVKLVWSSTFTREARSYRMAAGAGERAEKMAVVIQEVVGRRHGGRFYPDLSGVARSYSYYRSGRARPEDGVVQLALGLGKTIVDGGVTWTYSPAQPKAPPPCGSARELLKATQTEFWAVQMGGPKVHDPVREDEFLVRGSLTDAEFDGTLRLLASTYDGASDRLVPGVEVPGPRVLSFAPLLVHEVVPLNRVLRAILTACEETLGAPVEMEFAATFESGNVTRLGLLQVRPMNVSSEVVDVTFEKRARLVPLVRSGHVLGNGVADGIADVVYLRKEKFELRRTREAAAEIATKNSELLAEERPYLLIGFGRWGSSDPWLGLPVEWGDIAGVRALVELSPSERPIEPSQGSHFFHNIQSFRVGYFSLPAGEEEGLDWTYLDSLEAVSESELLRHVRLASPLLVEVDGRSGRGIIWRREETP